MKYLLRCMALSLLLLTVSCRDPEGTVSSDFINFSSCGMSQGREYILNMESDTLMNSDVRNINVYLVVRYNKNYMHEGVRFDYEISSLQLDSVMTGTIDIPLFSKEGKSLAKTYMSLYEKDTLIMAGLPYPADYNMVFSTPQSDTRGIISLGVTLQNSDEHK